MVRSITVSRLIGVLCLLLLSACVFQQREINTLASHLLLTGAQSTLDVLTNISPTPRDRIQYFLNRGRLKSITGDTVGSISDLQGAKTMMLSLQALSVSENLAAVTINDTLRMYSGTPSERVMVHLMLAYNFLKLGDLDSARVEMLQADVTMRTLSEQGPLSGQLASVHFTTGLVYELNNEFDNAMISYRRTAQIMELRQQPLPVALQDSLLQISKRQGLKKEYAGYVKRFSRKAIQLKHDKVELIVIYADGKVSNMEQHVVRVFSDKHNQFLSLAIPYYPATYYSPQPFSFSVEGRYYSTALLEDMEHLVRKDLAVQTPKIMASALVRAAAKYKMVDNAHKQGELAQFLMNIATTVTETADTRSWNMLPSNIQIARVWITQKISANNAALMVGVSNDNILSFNGGKKLLLFVNSIK